MWQVLGSNQRRLSRRFYRPPLLSLCLPADQRIRPRPQACLCAAEEPAVHGESVVLAERLIGAKTNEVPEFAPLLRQAQAQVRRARVLLVHSSCGINAASSKPSALASPGSWATLTACVAFSNRLLTASWPRYQLHDRADLRVGSIRQLKRVDGRICGIPLL